jgi:tRNA isopentenyl-2-thiomethyl-A-37 hydroxylase MiaE
MAELKDFIPVEIGIMPKPIMASVRIKASSYGFYLRNLCKTQNPESLRAGPSP